MKPSSKNTEEENKNVPETSDVGLNRTGNALSIFDDNLELEPGFAAELSTASGTFKEMYNEPNSNSTESSIPNFNTPPVPQQRKSTVSSIVSKFTDKFRKKSATEGLEARTGTDSEANQNLSEVFINNLSDSPTTSKAPVDETPALRTISEEGVIKKSALKRSNESGLTIGSAPVSFAPDVEVQSAKPRRSYNPFSSFEKNIPISNPDKKRSRVSSDYNRSSSVASSNRKGSSVSERGRKVSVVDLSTQNISVCFFPEEIDWDDDEDDPRLIRFSAPGSVSQKGTYGTNKELEWVERERWDSRIVYLLALITYSISFSNIYHFPLLVYRYSGYFLVPYTIFTIILGYPLHFLESALGQYSQSGPVKVWDCVPLARGVGWAMFFLCVYIAYFYNAYAAYSVVYFSRCFMPVLPWQDCDISFVSNTSCVPRMCARSNLQQQTPAEHYFLDHVLDLHYSGDKALSTGLGGMMWKQVLGFFLAWFVVYVAIIQSVRSIGKCVYFLVVLPYFILLMMLTAGFMLEGSSRGWNLLFGSSPSANIFDIQMWRSAAEEVFFELGICQGIPLVYGSYCHHRNPTHIDSGIICIVNYFTSLLCALVLFNLLGALSLEMGDSARAVTNKEAGLVFILYPDALCRIPGSNFWCVIFFLMLFSVVIGTQIAVMETVMTVIYDEFPNALPYRWFINMLACSGLFVLGMVLCTSNGFFVVHLLDRMTGAMPRLPIAVFMVGAIVFIYGMRKFCEDMHFMINYFPNLFLRVCLFSTPFILLILTIASWTSITSLTIFNKPYEKDAISVGWFTVWFILLWILIGAIYWFSHCVFMGQTKLIFKSLNSWGPRNIKSRIARTEFSSDQISNFTEKWR